MTRARQPGDAGASLVEVLAALALVGLATVALLSGLLTLAAASRLRDDQVRDDLLLRTLAEVVKAAPFEPCGGTGYADMFDAPAGTSGSVEAVTYWTGEPAADPFSDDCVEDLGVQKVTLLLTDDDADVEDGTRLTLVKWAGP
jgi:hypothetical protein